MVGRFPLKVGTLRRERVVYRICTINTAGEGYRAGTFREGNDFMLGQRRGTYPLRIGINVMFILSYQLGRLIQACHGLLYCVTRNQ